MLYNIKYTYVLLQSRLPISEFSGYDCIVYDWTYELSTRYGKNRFLPKRFLEQYFDKNAFLLNKLFYWTSFQWENEWDGWKMNDTLKNEWNKFFLKDWTKKTKWEKADLGGAWGARPPLAWLRGGACPSLKKSCPPL